MLEGTVWGSVTHWGQVTDMEMIYGHSCDTVLTSLVFYLESRFSVLLVSSFFVFFFFPTF